MRWLVLVVGCYAPNTPSGAYLCSVVDGACPSGQHCHCGLCVNRDQDAACGFNVAPSANNVAEHESFSVDITALQDDKTTAAGFNDTVTLSFVLPDGSAWCDVKPSTVQLKNGKATGVPVTLNRETSPPQKPKLRVVFAGNKGDSPGMQVTAPPFVKDPMPVVPPVSAQRPFAWADTFVAEPGILRDGSGYRMYFFGLSASGGKLGIGMATSADAIHFTPTAEPVWTPSPNTWYPASVQSPGPFFTSKGISLAFTGLDQVLMVATPGQVGVAESTDGMSFAVGNGGQPVIHRETPMHMADCDYCKDGIDFPNVIDAPADLDSETLGGKLMFFSGNSASKTAVIGRASSNDEGKTWTPEPAPVLQGELGGEALLLAPHVLIDGTVFKMWYSFVTLRDALNTGGDLCKMPVHIGYATSKDGFYWVRSPSNLDKPAVTAGGGGWDATTTGFIAGAAVPTDGSDPANGVALYYSTSRHVVETDPTTQCVANGIGRATRM
jgi:hypothetical protein